MHTDCAMHDWPDGALLTRERLPRCPLCRVALGHKLGPRPRARRTQRTTTTYLDPRQRAAGEHLDGL